MNVYNVSVAHVSEQAKLVTVADKRIFLSEIVD
jgi:hypothetical protein